MSSSDDPKLLLLRTMRSPTRTTSRKKLHAALKKQQHLPHYKMDQSLLYLIVGVIGFVAIIPFIGFHQLSKNKNNNNNNRALFLFAPSTSSRSSTSRSVHTSRTSTSTSTTSTSTSSTSTSMLDDTLPLIHIVNSRFQQHAHNLTAIGQARLELFETFCLPSMIHQTIQPKPSPLLHNYTTTNETTTAPTSPPQKYRFIWIIKVDPNLDIHIRTKLQTLLQPYPNFFLVGSNNNFGASYGTGIEPGSWRNGMAGEDVLFGNVTTNVTHEYQKLYGTPIFTGDVSLLHVAHAQRASKIILETRLDADDGLPTHYLQEIQSSAIQHLSIDPNELYLNTTTTTTTTTTKSQKYDDNTNSTTTNNDDDEEEEEEEEEGDDGYSPEAEELKGKAKWLYWCIPHSISWHPTVLENGFDPHIQIQEGDPGRLILDTNKGNIICMTPGLTSGMSVGVQDSDMPRYSHYDLLSQLKRFTHNPRNNCGAHRLSLPCLQVLDEEAVRSRTPTSAGMKNVELSSKLNYTHEEIEDQWNYMFETFGIRRDRAVACNTYIQQNLVSILQDNLQNQCSHGHSCKTKARLQLLSMIEATQNRTTAIETADLFPT
jgi:hypothetical protein